MLWLPYSVKLNCINQITTFTVGCSTVANKDNILMFAKKSLHLSFSVFLNTQILAFHTDLVLGVKKNLFYLIRPFYTCMSELHTQRYGDPSLVADRHTLPLTPRSASPPLLCRVSDHGSQCRFWRAHRASRPSCCQVLCHYNWLAQLPASATLACSTTSGYTDARFVTVCLCYL